MVYFVLYKNITTPACVLSSLNILYSQNVLWPKVSCRWKWKQPNIHDQHSEPIKHLIASTEIIQNVLQLVHKLNKVETLTMIRPTCTHFTHVCMCHGCMHKKMPEKSQGHTLHIHSNLTTNRWKLSYIHVFHSNLTIILMSFCLT